MVRLPAGRLERDVVDRIRFQTETDSVYQLTRLATGEMTWRRLSTTMVSGTLRTEHARLLEWPEVAIGARCHLVSEPINPPYPRFVITSVVVAILEAVLKSDA